MSTLYVDNLEPNLGSRVMAAGHVVQVVNSTENATSGYNNGADTGTYQNLMSASITPYSASSKILVTASVCVGTNDYGVVLRILQGGSTVASHLGLTGDSRSSVTFGTVPYATNDDEIATATYSGLFSPSSTELVNYTVQGAKRSAGNWAFNRSEDSSSASIYRSRGVSSIVLMEIAQ